MIPDLNDATFKMLSMKAYYSPTFLMVDYEEEIKRIKYLKRLFGKYRGGGELKERLILNHLIILTNCFGV